LKRQEKPISSTYLWKKAIQDLRVNSPLQKLRKNLLLWLQLALLALLVLGRARPTLNLAPGERKNVICLIDTSASMCATDETPNRLEAAKRQAQRLVANMRSADRMMLVTFDAKPAVLAPYTSVKSQLRDAIRDIQPTESSTNVGRALELVAALARDAPDVELYILSDGRFDLAAAPELPGVTPHYIQVGSRGNNVGITALDARRNVEYEAQVDLFARVENFGELDADVRLELHLDDKLFDARDLHLAPGGKAGVVFSDPALKEGLARVGIASIDDLAVDNAAWLELVQPRRLRVLVVTPGNYFLELALTHDPLCDPVFMNGETFDADLASGRLSLAEHDVVVFDRTSPRSLPSGAYLFLGALPPLPSFASQGPASRPAVIDWDGSHPVNRYVAFANLFIESALKMTVPPEAHTLVDGQAGPLVVWWSDEAYRIIVVGFDMFESRWPLRVSFPIFLANSLRHLGAVETNAAGSRVSAGQAISFSVDPGLNEVRLSPPTGAPVSLPVQSGKVTFGDTRVCGPYVFALGGDHARTYVVNLLDPAESDTAPRPSISWAGTALASTGAAANENREIWRAFVLAALSLLLLEWYIYNRRVYL
ncbi:MAG: VWA domain-containing protein, partial [Planctomycetota bacterium]